MSYTFIYHLPCTLWDLERDAFYVTYTCYENTDETAAPSPSCASLLIL